MVKETGTAGRSAMEFANQQTQGFINFYLKKIPNKHNILLYSCSKIPLKFWCSKKKAVFFLPKQTCSLGRLACLQFSHVVSLIKQLPPVSVDEAQGVLVCVCVFFPRNC